MSSRSSRAAYERDLEYTKQLLASREKKEAPPPHVYTPGEKAGIAIGCIVIAFLVIFLPLYITHPEFFKPTNAPTQTPSNPFSCATDPPTLYPPATNGLYIRKPFNSTDRVYVQNTQYFLDKTATMGLGLCFWYRMPFYSCLTSTCAVGSQFDPTPLWRRADPSGSLWQVNLQVYPVSSGTGNPIKIKFFTPNQTTVFYATPQNNARIDLTQWHFICYDIVFDTNRQTTGFDCWIDAQSLDVVSATEGTGPALFPISPTSGITLNLGAGAIAPGLPDSTPIQQQDCDSMSYYGAPFSQIGGGDANAAILTLYNAGQQNCTVAVGSGAFGQPNLGCWLLGKGDVPFTWGYDSRTDKCVKAYFTSGISIQTTN